MLLLFVFFNSMLLQEGWVDNLVFDDDRKIFTSHFTGNPFLLNFGLLGAYLKNMLLLPSVGWNVRAN